MVLGSRKLSGPLRPLFPHWFPNQYRPALSTEPYPKAESSQVLLLTFAVISVFYEITLRTVLDSR